MIISSLPTSLAASGPLRRASVLAAFLLSAAILPAQAQAQRASATSGQAQALLLETAGKWQAFSSQQGRAKVCYALSKAETRQPANLKDVDGLLFVSSRPSEGVRNEISLVMNFDLREDVEHQAIVGDERFALVAKGQNMWLKNPAEEPRMLDSLRRGADLEIKGTSKRGNPTSDKYSLAGVTQTVKRAEDACK
jgi:invasion protein IalB